MKQVDYRAADYWIENTDRIYKEKLHISGPVMDAYRAGFIEAREQALEAIKASGCEGAAAWRLEEAVERLGENESY